jgi:hypothetical protein
MNNVARSLRRMHNIARSLRRMHNIARSLRRMHNIARRLRQAHRLGHLGQEAPDELTRVIPPFAALHQRQYRILMSSGRSTFAISDPLRHTDVRVRPAQLASRRRSVEASKRRGVEFCGFPLAAAAGATATR